MIKSELQKFNLNSNLDNGWKFQCAANKKGFDWILLITLFDFTAIYISSGFMNVLHVDFN